MLYLTPQRFRGMGFGIDISELDDAELLALISQATTVVNAYCNVPRIPQPHDFKGGIITGERQVWRYPVTPFEIGQRRFYPMHWPVISVESFRIYVTNTQFVGLAPTDLIINNTERYFEVVSLALTSSGLFNALIIPNVGLATPVAAADYTYGWDLIETDELLSNTDGQTYRAQNQFWFSDSTRLPVVKKNGSVVSSGFTVDSIEGAVVFTVQLTASDTVTATYHYPLPPDIQFGCGHIVAYLHGQAELHSRGMAHLTALKVAEVSMTRRDPKPASSLVAQLDDLIPEAAILLSGYRNDSISVR